MLKAKLLPLALVISSSMLLSACNDDDDDNVVIPDPEMTYRYQVTITNLTYAQPFSPVSVVLHETGNLWQIGEAASAELENQAESGDNSGILGLFPDSASSEGILMPGNSTVVEVSIIDIDDAMLSVSTMLVNTNDAFVGLNAMSLADMAVGDEVSVMGHVYDAGTEGNTEASGSIPGPADGGEGFNAARDDVDFVAMHPGVVGMDDGLSTSVLTQAHKFDNPAVHFTVSRVE